jgi:hypothetical protein
MYDDRTLEKTRFRDRMKEIRTLCIFIFFSIGISIVLMDAIIYPLTSFSIKHTKLYSRIVVNVSWLVLAGAFIAFIASRFRTLRREGFAASQIIRYFGRRTGSAIAAFFMVLIAAGLLTGVIYMLLNYNYYLLYKLTSN